MECQIWVKRTVSQNNYVHGRAHPSPQSDMKISIFLTSTEYYHLATSAQITPWVTHYLVLPAPWI